MTKEERKEIEELERRLAKNHAQRVAWVKGTDGPPDRVPLELPDVPLIFGPRTKEECEARLKELEKEDGT